MKLALLLVLTAFGIWVLLDLTWPARSNLRQFDSEQVARLDGAMWRSYYEKKPLKLLWQSAELCRNQFGVPFWQSFRLAFYAAKAAFAFKDGKNRPDYERALPPLTQYFARISALSDAPFDAAEAARFELEWWIIRRERTHHPPAEWVKFLAKSSAIVYHQPAASFNGYARLRVQAMLYRDARGEAITEADWVKIEGVLRESWGAFRRAVGAERLPIAVR